MNEKIKNDFFEDIKIEVNEEYIKKYQLKEFMKELKKNTDLIKKLSDDRLELLISYYEKITNEKKEKLKKLKKSL